MDTTTSCPSDTRPQLHVRRLPMAHPGDLSALAALLDAGDLRAHEIVAVIGKTEGNGGVNDFTRGYFTQSLIGLLATRLGRPAEALVRELPCVLSGGTERTNRCPLPAVRPSRTKPDRGDQ